MANKPNTPNQPGQPGTPQAARRQVEATPVDELLAEAAGPTDRAEEFIRNHWKTLTAVIGGALLLVIAVVVVRGYQQRHAELAAEAFTSAQTVEEFEAVVRNFPDTVAAGNALLLKSELLWEQGERQRAVDTLEQYLREFPNHPLRPQTSISLGSRLEAMDRPSAAEGHYRHVIEGHADTPYAPMAQLRLAEVQLASGNIEAGRSLLEQMPSTFPLYGPSFLPLAEERIRQLDAGLPRDPVPMPPDAPVEPDPVMPGLGLDLEDMSEFLPEGFELTPGLPPGVDPSLPQDPADPLGTGLMPDPAAPAPDAGDAPALPDLPDLPDLPELPDAPLPPAEPDADTAADAPTEPMAEPEAAEPDAAEPAEPSTPEAPAPDQPVETEPAEPAEQDAATDAEQVMIEDAAEGDAPAPDEDQVEPAPAEPEPADEDDADNAGAAEENPDEGASTDD